MLPQRLLSVVALTAAAADVLGRFGSVIYFVFVAAFPFVWHFTPSPLALWIFIGSSSMLRTIGEPRRVWFRPSKVERCVSLKDGAFGPQGARRPFRRRSCW